MKTRANALPITIPLTGPVTLRDGAGAAIRGLSRRAQAMLAHLSQQPGQKAERGRLADLSCGATGRTFRRAPPCGRSFRCFAGQMPPVAQRGNRARPFQRSGRPHRPRSGAGRDAAVPGPPERRQREGARAYKVGALAQQSSCMWSADPAADRTEALELAGEAAWGLGDLDVSLALVCAGMRANPGLTWPTA